jgi:hypothetical protein
MLQSLKLLLTILPEVVGIIKSIMAMVKDAEDRHEKIKRAQIIDAAFKSGNPDELNKLLSGSFKK